MKMIKNVMIALFLLAGMVNAAQAQTVVVKWNFNDDNTTADGGISANLSKDIITTATGAFTYPAGLNTSHCISATGWDGGIDSKYWQIEFTTTGYQNLTVSSFQKSSGTGPKDFKLQYKIGDAGAWTDVTGGTIVCANDAFVSGVLNNLALPSECANQASVYLRWVMTTNGNVSGSGDVASTGTSRMEDLTVSGTETSGPDVTPPAFVATYPQAQNITSNGFNVAIQLDEPGTAYCQVLAQGTTAPTVNELMTNGTSVAIVAANTTYTASFSGLTPTTPYDVYVVAKDDEATPNVQAAVTMISVTTGVVDNTAPAFIATFPQAVNITAFGFILAVQLDEAGIAYYQVLAHGATAPTVNELMASGNTIAVNAANTSFTGTITGLTAETTYDVYVVAEDNEATPNVQAAVSMFEVTTGVPVAADLFFSEYIEGSGNNKAIEIYNPTGAAVDLSAYTVKQAYNGNNWDYVVAGHANYTVTLTGTLAAGDVYVMYATGAGPEITAAGDWTKPYGNAPDSTKLVYFTGNDAMGIFKGGELIDVIGNPTSNANIAVAGITDAAINHTLVRKFSVTSGTTDWATAAGTDADNSQWVVFPLDDFSHIGFHGASSAAEILTFALPSQTGAATITSASATIAIEVGFGTDLTTLVPTFTVSPGAQVSPTSGATVNFSSPVVFHVTAEDNFTVKDWTVTVTTASVSDATDITGFVLAQQFAPATIDAVNHTVTMEVVMGSDLTQLTPTITLSYGATINPASGTTLDFTTDSVLYTVTAENGIVTQDWYVTITEHQVTITSIHDIQYVADTANLSPSPFFTQIVTTQGIVTGKGSQGFFIQDGNGPWSGLYIYTTTVTVNIGDLIIITGKVDEFFGFTELKNISSWNVISTNNTLPEPMIITGHDFHESLEGVLVKAEHYTCFKIPVSGEHNMSWYRSVSDPTDSISTHTLMLYPFFPLLNSTYSFTGIINYSFNYYRVEPRDSADVTVENIVNDPPTITEIQFNPNPPVQNVETQVSALIEDDSENLNLRFYWGLQSDSLLHESELLLIGFTEPRYAAIVPAQATDVVVYFAFMAADAYDTTWVYGNYTVTSSISDIRMARFTVSPNPATDRVTISNMKNAVKFVLSDILGNTLREENISSERITLNIGDLSNGVYFITVVDNQGMKHSQRLIKK